MKPSTHNPSTSGSWGCAYAHRRRYFRSVTNLTTKVRIGGRGYLWGSFLIAAAVLKTLTRNGYNAQGVNLKCISSYTCSEYTLLLVVCVCSTIVFVYPTVSCVDVHIYTQIHVYTALFV